MEVVLWILILLSFVLAFVGLIKPIIPSVLVLWVGFLIYQFGFSQDGLSWIFYVAMILFTVFILVSDFLMNKYFVNRFGGSKLGEYAALIGVIIGCFVIPPFGIIIVPFIAVLIVELVQDFDFGKALKSKHWICSSIFSEFGCTSVNYVHYGHLVLYRCVLVG